MHGTQDEHHFVAGPTGHSLLLSMRRIEKIVAYSGCYEFEDVIAAVTGADRVDVGQLDAINLSRRTYRLARAVTGSPAIARKLSLTPPELALQRDYEFFFPVFNHPHELYALRAIPNWRERCRVAACYICEAFPHLMPTYLLELISSFDHIFVGSRTSASDIARITGRPCTYLPFASDVLRFSPVPIAPERNIDVCNIGRRSQVTHEALIKLARERKIFYYYDTVAASGINQKQRTFQVQDASEHRLLLANVLQRSRYYIANRSRANEASLAKDSRQEISGRFYEGAAAGTVLLGEPPDCAEFREQFYWPDALIELPFDSSDIGELLADLNTNPGRLATISRQNIHHAALRHDWTYRIRKVFELVGMPLTPGMHEREQQLQQVAALALEQ